MAGEGDESRNGRMDLNLYLGLPRSPRPRALDLGSDLALGSIPHPSSSSSPTAAVVAGDSHSLMDVEASGDADSLVPYSPSSVPYDADLPSIDPVITADQRPYTPSYIPIPPIDEATQELGLDIPYSPSRVRLFQFSPVSDEQMAGDSNTNSLYPYRPSRATSSPGVVDESYIPTPASSVPRVSTPRGHNGGEHRRHDHGSSSQGDLLQYPEHRFQRLIESQNRLGVRRFRLSSNSSGGERSDLGRQLLPAPEPALQNSVGKTKVVGKGNAAEGSEEESEEKSKDATNFDCNVCFDMAKEPVVTSCGHLFCWPCLYQWLHVYSRHKECPICKGEVVESNIIPIYGRGSLEVREESIQVEGRPGLKIPPRPRGNRLESFRQQMEPITRRLEEMSWRRLFTERMLNGDRLGDAAMHEMFEIGHRRLLATLRAGLMHEGNMERGLNAGEGLRPRNNTTDPQNSHASSPLPDGMGLWQRFSLDLGRVVERLATSNNRLRAAVSSANPPNPPNPQSPPILVPSDSGLHVASAIAADQASPSSTMAVIQGDTATTNDTAAEPNNAGSSSSLRRRARSSTCLSSDVDGGALHACKRRRLN